MSELTRLAHECCEVLDLDPAEFAVPIEQHLARAVAALEAENERLRADKDVWGEAHEVACRRAEQAEREGQRLSDVATFQLDRAEKLQAEVERLKGELNEAKEEVRRQVEMRLLDQGRHHVDLQEASSQHARARGCTLPRTHGAEPHSWEQAALKGTLAAAIYEAEERLRAEHEHGIAHALWTPWNLQTSRRERGIYEGIAACVMPIIIAAIEQARREGMEEAAKIADAAWPRIGDRVTVQQKIAAAIRARAKESEG